MIFKLLINTEIANSMEISDLNYQSQSFILLMNVKMPTIVAILTFFEQYKFHPQLS